MIVAYTQAEDRDGILAARDGRQVVPTDHAFSKLREVSTDLNVTSTVHRAGDVDVRYGKGIVRLELMGADDPDRVLSPIIVVAEVGDLIGGRATAVRTVVDSVAAIGRLSEADSISNGFAEGVKLHQARNRARRIGLTIGVVLLASIVVWIASQLLTSATGR